jgi:hypothetical protein
MKISNTIVLLSLLFAAGTGAPTTLLPSGVRQSRCMSRDYTATIPFLQARPFEEPMR